MKISVKHISIVFIFLLSHNLSYGQISSNGIENIEQEISDLILQQTGDTYYIAAYNKKYYPNLNFGFENPNQIFSNGYLFTTMGPVDNDSDERYAFVGIYKDGGILWQSEKEILFNNLNSEVLGILDINGDGNVEIISQWDQGMRGTSTELWIYSWNGVSGERINTIDVFGESEIKLKDYSIQVVDFEPNGIKEIIGVDWNDEPVTFQWDGMG
ncbi:MAG: hypothetical protein JJ895_11520 [Balneolaceae bacterium]|nr:hypothetical protein [Balneolaceae bacterium]